MLSCPRAGRSAGHALPQPEIEILLLGPLQIRAAGTAVTPKATRAQRLLALLALNANRVVSIDSIVSTVWREPPHSARQQVYNVVTLARRSLAPAGQAVRILTDGPGYRLAVDARCIDADRFEHHLLEAERAEAGGSQDAVVESLNAALDQWRGPALTGLGGAVFANAATVLEDRRLTAIDRLAEAHFRMGHYPRLVRELPPLVLEHPFRESLRALLMKSLSHTGRQADAVAVYGEGRRLLSEELGLDPGPGLQDAQAYVLRGHAAHGGGGGGFGQESEVATGGTSDSFGHSYLPRDIREFTGRREQIDRVRQFVADAAPNAPVVVSLDGLGGVGKTSLAVHIAHELAPDYPDGQYFIDLSGCSGVSEPIDPTDALGVLLRDSGVQPESVPSSPEERSALWRSRTAGLKVLVLLDNAKDAGQVSALLPSSPGSLVLITSRPRLTALAGASMVFLDDFTDSEALDLFTSIVGAGRVEAEPAATAQVIELCGRLPLAIQIAAARMRDRPGWSVAYLVAQLRDEQTRSRVLDPDDRGIINVLSWSYEKLPAASQRVFRLLGSHLGPELDARSIAAIAGLPLHEATACAETLCDANLLRQPTPGRFRMHHLVRLCAWHLSRKFDDASTRYSAIVRHRALARPAPGTAAATGVSPGAGVGVGAGPAPSARTSAATRTTRARADSGAARRLED